MAEELLPVEVSDIIEALHRKIYIVDEMMISKKRYKNWVKEIYDYIKAGIEFEELRRCPVSFKFREEDEEVYKLPLPNFLTNLMLWEAFMRLHVIDLMDKSFIFDARDITPSNLNNYFNTKIIEPYRHLVSNKTLNRIMHDVTFNLSRISTDFNIILGISISINSFINLAKESQRFNEIINTKVPEDMQPAEIEKYLDGLMHEEMEILRTHDNCLRPMLEAQVGIKDKQLKETTINGGTKPDLFGNTIPIPINGNFLVGGLQNLENYAIDAMGGRKASIMSKSMMGISGHFATSVILLSSSVKFSGEEDCGSLYPVHIYIKNIKMLYKFVGRYYKESLMDTDYKIIRKADQHLVGKVIYVRTPVTCASKRGVCKMCYGHLYEINKDLESPGAYSAIKLTMPVSQDILSSKHLLSTTSTKIEFNEAFHECFKISANNIIMRDDEDFDPFNYTLVIKEEDLLVISECDENMYNHFVKRFFIRRRGENELIEINELNDNKLYIDQVVFRELEKTTDSREISLSKIESNRLFVIEIKNNELTKPLYDIMELLDKKEDPKTEGPKYKQTIHSAIARMNDLMIESNINLQSVHAEMILYSLVRCKDNILERPDFSTYGADNYFITTVKGALENHASPIIGISFQYLKRQLTKRPLTYSKAATSVLDPLFKQ